MIEVMIDQLADELGMDPLELRRKNFIPRTVPERQRRRPASCTTPGNYDSDARQAARARRPGRVPPRAGGSCAPRASTAASASPPTPRSAASRRRGSPGPAAFGAAGAAAGSRRWSASTTPARSRVYTGTSPHGQGHETAFAQIVADRLGVDPASVEVIHGDTGTGPEGRNTYGSRSLAVGGEALAARANKVADKAKAIVAHHLEAAPEDIELSDGKFSVKGSPDKGMTLAEVAGAAYLDDGMPEGMEPGLEETVVLRPRELRVPVRRARLRRRRRRRRPARSRSSATSRSTTAAGDQPAADRRPGARRHRARDRAGAVRARRTTTRTASS